VEQDAESTVVPAVPGIAPGDERSALRVARQPILDGSSKLLGYELLFRPPLADEADVLDDVSATSSVIVDGLLDVGLFDLVGDSRAWVNVSRDFLTDLRPLPLPAERVVLELIEGGEPDDELLDVLGELRGNGFAIALDAPGEGAASEELLARTEIVKVDVLGQDPERLAEQVADLRRERPELKLVAKRVETREDYELCAELGFDAFQGYYFARPTRVGGERLPSEGLTALRAMTELNLSDDFDELNRIITRDVGLSMRLLRYANSGFVALPRRVSSVHEALSWLGASAVRRFALMVALSGARDIPSELLVTALVRARMCELLCTGGPLESPDTCFTVGLFSVADALANAPMPAVIEQLPFREDVAAALLSREGELGELVRGVIAYQYGNFGAAVALRRRHPSVEQIYREAVKWADLSSAGLV
jgi:EAL and modified HD-GYP domain-containing signal transduction protein